VAGPGMGLVGHTVPGGVGQVTTGRLIETKPPSYTRRTPLDGGRRSVTRLGLRAVFVLSLFLPMHGLATDARGSEAHRGRLDADCSAANMEVAGGRLTVWRRWGSDAFDGTPVHEHSRYVRA